MPSRTSTIAPLEGVDRSLFQTPATCQWIRDANHLVIVGPTGTGNSWLVCALGNTACRDRFSVFQASIPPVRRFRASA
ncbi:ATP-binding protein [Bradyrhizobium sp. CCBAU 53380]|uniref:ATP-binding protein n=1 Tax=Bradyrhizobium sp. CCBAU 53380 TaxID=1325117 RepID=UPI002FDF4565